MKTGNETWKWGLVFILLAVFLVVANQAYVHISSQEDYPPPDDYLKGDSWDIEHQQGPGAGQPMQMKPEKPTDNNSQTDSQESPQSTVVTPVENAPEHKEEIDWDKVQDLSED